MADSTGIPALDALFNGLGDTIASAINSAEAAITPFVDNVTSLSDYIASEVAAVSDSFTPIFGTLSAEFQALIGLGGPAASNAATDVYMEIQALQTAEQQAQVAAVLGTPINQTANTAIQAANNAAGAVYTSLGLTPSAPTTGAQAPIGAGQVQGPSITGQPVAGPTTYSPTGPLQGPTLNGQTLQQNPTNAGPTPPSTGVFSDIEAFITSTVQSFEDYYQKVIDDITIISNDIDNLPTAAGTLVSGWAQSAWNFLTSVNWRQSFRGLDNWAANFNYFFFGVGAPGNPPWGTGAPQGLTLPNDRSQVDSYVGAATQIINSPRHFWEYIMSWAVRIATAGTAFGATITPLINEIEQEANAKNPQTALETVQIIEAQHRGTIAPGDAPGLAARNGISPGDYQTIYNNTLYIPDLGTALRWYQMGLITIDQYNAYAIPNKTDPVTAAVILQGSIRPASGSQSVGNLGRQSADAAGLMGSIAAESVPEDILKLYDAAGVSRAQATVDNISRASIPSPEWFAAAAYKGIRPATDISRAAIASNYPADIAAQFQDVIRPILPVRVVTTLYSQKVIDKATAESNYTKLGYSAADVALLIAYAEGLTVRKPKSSYGDLSTLALSDATGLFMDGTIPESELTQVFIAHGYSVEASALSVQYIVLKQKAAARKQVASDIVTQVDLGIITQSTAVASLYSKGYTSSEVLRYEKQMAHAKATKTKNPSVAEIKSMYKAGTISLQDVENYIVSENYAQQYWPGLLKLYTSPAATPTPTGAG